MEAIHKLRVECPYEILNVEDIKIECKPYDHGYLKMKCLIDDTKNFEYAIKASTEDKICIYEEIEDDDDSIIFNGLIQNIRTTNFNGIYYLEIDAVTSSFLLDIEEKSRSFQDTEMTYYDVIEEILKDYKGFGYSQRMEESKKIGKPLFQYKETDFNFIKRLASHLGIDLVSDIEKLSNMFYFGRPIGDDYALEDEINYRAYKDLKKYYITKPERRKEFHDTDYFYYEIEIREKMDIGDLVYFRGNDFYVNQFTAKLYEGQLIYCYRLCREKGIWQEEIYNEKLKGISLEGKVLAVKDEIIKLHLDIDKEQNEDKAYWFTFAPPTGNVMYSMPIVGTNAFLYFPNVNKADPIVIGCVRKNGSTYEKFSDVNKRYYTTEHKNQLAMIPESISLVCSGKPGLSVTLDDGKGVRMKSDKNLTLTTPEEIVINTDTKVIMYAKDKLTAQKEGTESKISLENDMYCCGDIVHENGSCNETFEPCNPAKALLQINNMKFVEPAKAMAGAKAAIASYNHGTASQSIMFQNQDNSAEDDTPTIKQASKNAIPISSDKEIPGLDKYNPYETKSENGTYVPSWKLNGKVEQQKARDNTWYSGTIEYDSYTQMFKFNAYDKEGFKESNKEALDGAFEFMAYGTPFIGNAICLDEVITGDDFFTGKKLTTGERILNAIFILSGGLPKIESKLAESTVKDVKKDAIKGVEKDVTKSIEKDVTKNATKDVEKDIEIEAEKKAEKEAEAYNDKIREEVNSEEENFNKDENLNNNSDKDYIEQDSGENYIKDSNEGDLKGSDLKDPENKVCDHDPVDTVTGSLYIPATDMVLPDIHEEFKIERKYESVNKKVGIIGKGWRLNFESFLAIENEKVKVLCTDGHVEIFNKINEEWVNNKGKRKRYTLEKDSQYWIFKSNKDKKTYKYDEKGKLLEITNKFGNKLRIEYIENNIKTLKTFSNYKLFFTYKDGKVAEIKDEVNRVVKYEYEGDYLINVIHGDTGVTKYSYNEKGYVENITDQNRNTYSKSFYDREGRVIRQEYPNGDFATVSYDDGERLNTFYNNGSQITHVYKYNRKGLVTHVLYDDGTAEEYKYDEHQNKIYIKDRNGYETKRAFDEEGNLLKEALPNGLITEYTYDENKNLIKEKDNKEKEIIYAYDSSYNLIEKKTKISVANWKTETYKYDSKGRILRKTDGRGNTTKYDYENQFYLDTKLIKDPIRVTTNSGYIYQYEYDKVGRNVEIKTDYGKIGFSYNNLNYEARITDANGNLTVKNYDHMGNLRSFYTPNGCFNGNLSEEGYRYTYDFLDRLISIKNPLGIVEKSIRDTEGNIIKEVNPNYYNDEIEDGIGVEYAYDKDNRRIKTIYPDGGIERFFYDANGNVIKHVSPEYYDEEADDGLGYTYTYDSMNRLSSIINEEGVVEKTFEYDLHGNIIKEIDAEGNVSLFKYDLIGNIIEKRIPVDRDRYGKNKYNLTCYVYDKNSNKILEKHGKSLVSERDVCNSYHEIYFEYDEENRLIEVKDKYGAKARYKYDCLNNKTYESFKINDKTTKIIHYIHDKVGNLIQKKEEINGGFVSPETVGKNVWAITNYEYDKNGNITKIITPKGFEIGRVYDKADRLIEQHEKDETNGIFRSYVYKYDKTNNIVGISEYSGEEAKLISRKYVSENNYKVHWTERRKNKEENEKLFEEKNFKEDQKAKKYVYDPQNRLTHFVNFSGNTTRLFYDKNDRIIKQVLPEQYDVEKDDGVGTTYNYNLKGQVVEVKNALGETITKNTYDPKGNLKARVDGENNKVEYTYTLLGQIKDIITPNSRKEDKLAQSYKYDARGNITGITDGNGNKTSYLLDDWGRIIQITTPEGGVEKYTYDYAGNITSTTDDNGGTIEYIYNSLGQVSEIIDQEGNSEYFYYDNEGNLTKHIDRNENHVDRTYNLDKNLVSVKAYQVDEEAIAIDAEKAKEAREKAIEEAKKKAEESFYGMALGEPRKRRSFNERMKDRKEKEKKEEQERINNVNNPEKAEDPNKNKLNVVDQRFKYNPDGTLKSAYTGNMQYEYVYNIEGMLEAKSASGRTLLKYTYDKNNNLKTIKDITGKSSIYSYDEADRVKLIQDDKQNNLAIYDYYKNNNIKAVTVGNGLKTDYSYDGDGNIQSLVTISPNGEVLVDYNYAYDLNGNRLQKVSSKHKNFYTYDSINRLKEAAYDNRRESFTYDKVGNRLNKTTSDITNAIAVDVVEKYTYNVKNQLKELHNNFGINYFTYDKQGNTIKEETTTGNNIFEYNTLNQQVKAITKEGNTLVSRYDAEGLRAEIEENEKLTKFIFHKDNVLVEADKDFNSISRFTRGYEVVSADVAESSDGIGSNTNSILDRYYYTVDEQGSTALITDKYRNVKNEYYYDAFGAVLEAKEQVHNRITYTGQQYDGITGQYYLRARFYNPVIGRFTQEDIYRGDGLNLYAYCGNNPVGYYDPSGYLCSTKINQYNDEVRNFEGSRLEYLRNKFKDLEEKVAHQANYEKKIKTVEIDGKKITTGPYGMMQKAGLKDAHHIYQDAAVKELEAYKKSVALTVQVEGPANKIGTPHYIATQAQRVGASGTIGRERNIAYKSLRKAGFSVAQAKYLVREADKYFEELGHNLDSVTRIPGNRK